MGKSFALPETLTPRDKIICDGFLAGTSRKALAEQHKLTPQRIGQILHQPAAVAYLLRQAGNVKALLFAKVGAEILTRTEWGGTTLTDLIAVWKAAMPKELTLNVTDTRKDAEAIAAEIGKADDPAVVAQIERDLLISQEAR